MVAAPAKPPAEQAEQVQPRAQRASDAELRADGLLMLAAAMVPMLLDVEPAAAGNPLLTGKTVCTLQDNEPGQGISGSMKLPLRASDPQQSPTCSIVHLLSQFIKNDDRGL
jgi:hypothetical protein